MDNEVVFFRAYLQNENIVVTVHKVERLIL